MSMKGNQEIIEWKGVRQTMPDADTTVLVFAPGANDEVWLGYWDGDVWREVGSDEIDGRVTHWAEMPFGPRTRYAERERKKALAPPSRNTSASGAWRMPCAFPA